jgi:5-formyltetrahydrofolate cyclo-ligase
VIHASPELDPQTLGSKRLLRQAVLARREAVDPALRACLSAVVLAKVAGLDAFHRARGVLAYASFGSELDTRPFLHEVLASGRLLVLPRVERAARRLALHEVRDLDADLGPGTWGIPEPVPARCRPVEPGEIDFVLVPGVVFDPAGGRLGYGGGYYDRLLAAWPPPAPLLVAAAFELQVVPAVPALPSDRRVDLVITESRTYPRPRPGPTEDP